MLNAMSWVAQYVVAAVVFCVLDLVWLGTIAEDLYARHLSDLLAPSPDLGAAFAFFHPVPAVSRWFLLPIVLNPVVLIGIPQSVVRYARARRLRE